MDESNEYDKLKKKLNDYFTSKKKKHYEKYLFLKMKPTHGITTTMITACLRENANKCEFRMNRETKSKAINKKRRAFHLSKWHDISRRRKEIKPAQRETKASQRSARKPEKQFCHYCGLTGIHPQGKNSPAYGKHSSARGSITSQQSVGPGIRNITGNDGSTSTLCR